MRRRAGANRDDDLASILDEEIDRLPASCRLPVILCDVEGRTYDEAARHLGCPMGTVKSRLARRGNGYETGSFAGVWRRRLVDSERLSQSNRRGPRSRPRL